MTDATALPASADPAPAVIVRDAAEARAALAAAAALGRRVALMSPPGVSAALGPGVFAECVAAAGDHAAALDEALFDCGDAAGLAMAALRRGGLDVIVDLPDETRARIADMAVQQGRRAFARDTALAGRAVLDLAADAGATAATEARVTRFLEALPQ